MVAAMSGLFTVSGISRRGLKDCKNSSGPMLRSMTILGISRRGLKDVIGKSNGSHVYLFQNLKKRIERPYPSRVPSMSSAIFENLKKRIESPHRARDAVLRQHPAGISRRGLKVYEAQIARCRRRQRQNLKKRIESTARRLST